MALSCNVLETHVKQIANVVSPAGCKWFSSDWHASAGEKRARLRRCLSSLFHDGGKRSAALFHHLPRHFKFF